MHYNIPSDKIVFFGVILAIVFVALFITSKIKNASPGVKVFLGILIVLLAVVGAALWSDYYNLIPNFDPVPWF